MIKKNTFGFLMLSFFFPTVLNGCVSSYSFQSEQKFSTTPDLASVCKYKWTHLNALIRVKNVYSWSWRTASGYGHVELDPYIQEFTKNCSELESPDSREAILSAHYLNHVNRPARLSVAYLSIATLGLLPVPITDHYAVCLQAIGPDGSVRIGLAEGRLKYLGNLWGTMDTKHHKGEQESREAERQIMRDLTLQAWHKMWLSSGITLENAPGCREQIDDIAK